MAVWCWSMWANPARPSMGPASPSCAPGLGHSKKLRSEAAEPLWEDQASPTRAGTSGAHGTAIWQVRGCYKMGTHWPRQVSISLHQWKAQSHFLPYIRLSAAKVCFTSLRSENSTCSVVKSSTCLCFMLQYCSKNSWILPPLPNSNKHGLLNWCFPTRTAGGFEIHFSSLNEVLLPP